MYFLYTDEANIEPSSSFFIYGGVSIPSNNAVELSNAIEVLRKKFGYRPKDPLKFNTVERPAQITPDAHKEIKRLIIQCAVDFNVKIFVSLIYHGIASSPDNARQYEINRVCYHFDCFLKRENSHGFVFIDTFSDTSIHEILREKFSVGLIGLPYSSPRRLERILGFHLATIGSSNFSSVVDIIVGSLRYAVNSCNETDRYKVVRAYP